MPSFDTPEPIPVVIDLGLGDIQINASDRVDTVVEITPSDSSRDADVRVAEQIKVEYLDGQLLIKGPKQRSFGRSSRVGSVDVTVALPTGSSVHADATIAAVRSAGRLGQCRIKTSAGDVTLDHIGTADLATGAGAITVGQVNGEAKATTGTGRIRLTSVDGDATVKNSNGETWIGRLTGDLRAKAANGDITVDEAVAGVTAHTAAGDVRVGGLTSGTASLKTAFGEIEFSIRSGTAARLDLHTSFGRVRNDMEKTDQPAPSDRTVEVHAHTSYGDIVIRRA